MDTISLFIYCYAGFFIIYDIIFIICCIYLAIIEEWCCENKIPFFVQKCKNQIQICKNKFPSLINKCQKKFQNCQKNGKKRLFSQFTYIKQNMKVSYDIVECDTEEEKDVSNVENMVI